MSCYLYAAELGNPFAQHRLGFLYAEGRGVPKDPTQAYAWWAAAAMNGIAKARDYMTAIRREIPPADFEQAEMLAMENFLRASE